MQSWWYSSLWTITIVSFTSFIVGENIFQESGNWERNSVLGQKIYGRENPMWNPYVISAMEVKFAHYLSAMQLTFPKFEWGCMSQTKKTIMEQPNNIYVTHTYINLYKSTLKWNLTTSDEQGSTRRTKCWLREERTKWTSLWHYDKKVTSSRQNLIWISHWEKTYKIFTSVIVLSVQ